MFIIINKDGRFLYKIQTKCAVFRTKPNNSFIYWSHIRAKYIFSHIKENCVNTSNGQKQQAMLLSIDISRQVWSGRAPLDYAIDLYDTIDFKVMDHTIRDDGLILDPSFIIMSAINTAISVIIRNSGSGDNFDLKITERIKDVIAENEVGANNYDFTSENIDCPQEAEIFLC